MPVKSLLLAFGCFFLTTANATEETEVPDLEFLEFLGSFESPDGKWVDPMEIEEMLEQKEQSTIVERQRNRRITSE